MSVSAALPFLFFSALNGKFLNAVPLQVSDTLRSHHAMVAPHANLKEASLKEEAVAANLVQQAMDKLATLVEDQERFRKFMEQSFSGIAELKDNQSTLAKIEQHLLGGFLTQGDDKSGFFKVKFWPESAKWAHYIFVLMSNDKVHLFHSTNEGENSANQTMVNVLTTKDFFDKIKNILLQDGKDQYKIPSGLFLPNRAEVVEKSRLRFKVSEKIRLLENEDMKTVEHDIPS
jgi:hypothetical protein